MISTQGIERSEIRRILTDSEKAVWYGKPHPKAILLVPFLGFLFCAIIGTVLVANGELLGVMGYVLGVVIGVFFWYTMKVQEYAITTKRVIMKSGVIGTDFKSIPFDQMKNVMVDTGLMAKIFGGIGTVKIDTGRMKSSGRVRSSSRGASISVGGLPVRVGGGMSTSSRMVPDYDQLMYIDEPYEVYKLLQKSLTTRKESLYSGRADRESQGLSGFTKQ